MNAAADGAPAPPLTVLALNSGSSSLKFGLYRVDAARAEALLAGDHEAATLEHHRRCGLFGADPR